jgi:DNA-3-methyladenine glycosylase II
LNNANVVIAIINKFKNKLNLKSYTEILEYLAKDKTLYKSIQQLEYEIKPELDIDIYLSLLNSIISQQLSTKVVRIIWRRFTDLFVNAYPKPEILLSTDHSVLRGIGLSNNKAGYVKNVAEFSMQNDMSFEFLHQRTDLEIINYLTQIKGVGKWTVQMILMFPMDRMKRMYQIDLEKKELRQKLNEIAENWHPYKTLASKYIWKIGD